MQTDRAVIGLICLIVGPGLLVVARLNWKYIISFNRRFSGEPRNQFQAKAERASRWMGTSFLVLCGAAVTVNGLISIGSFLLHL